MIRAALLASVVLLASCGSDDGDLATERDPNAAATYTVSFESVWDQASFPTNFPSNPHFSGLIGATHSEQVRFWEVGQHASDGIELMAETGSKLTLFAEINDAKDEGKAGFVLSGGGTASPGTVNLEFDINEAYPLVTLVSMLAPSPDWFVGVHDLALFDTIANDWKDSVSIDLLVYDAGTDTGVQFNSANADKQPSSNILPLSSEMNDTDFVAGIHRSTGEHVGRMLFTRIR